MTLVIITLHCAIWESRTNFKIKFKNNTYFDYIYCYDFI